MSKREVTQSEVLNHEVIGAYTATRCSKAGVAKAGRVTSGLLKAAAKRGEIGVHRCCGRVTGSTVFYLMTKQQIDAIRAEAIRRAAE